MRCAACGRWNRARRHWASRNFFRCGSCGVLFLHPQPSAVELEEAYRTRYYVASGDTRPIYENTPTALAEQLLECFIEHDLVPASGGRVLDFGCGIGDFAQAGMRASLDVDAVETDRLAREVAERRGISVYESLEAIPAAKRADGYDLVALLDVLEHVREPVALIGTLRKLLRRNGALYLSVPNYQSPQARILGSRWDQATNPTHLFLFSARSLARVLELAGFRLQYLPCVLRDPRFAEPARLLSLSLQRLRLSATLRVIAAAR